MKDFEKYAISKGVNSNTLNDYQKFTNSIISPTIIEERQMNMVTMDVFSRLMADRIIFLGSPIDDEVANIITSQLMYLNSVDSESDIKLFINTPGGSCDDGLAIYDIMNWVDCDVSTYVMGLAASMGSIICSSGAKGKRYALPHSKILLHQPMSGTGSRTQESDFKIAYEELKKCKDTLYQILQENTGKSIEEITADADRDHWLSAAESLPGVYGPYGLIDEIITKKR
jgi:ATP-dependent Clp protease protease subunit